MTLFSRNKLVLMVCTLLLCLLVQGCQEDTVAPVPQTKRPPVKKAVAPSEEKQAEKKPEKKPYVYDPSGKRDPFLPFISVVAIGETGEEEEDVPLTELQKYELSQLKLVAVMEMPNKKVAMVQDPEGKGHTIYIGTLIGKNKGKVIEIQRGKVLIEEKYRDALGDVKFGSKELVIETPEGGK